ncbi:hypothetical protein Tco_0634582 [Tanacetum coccineum]
MASFKVLETQFQMFIKLKIYLNDEYIVMTRNYFLQYTQLDIPEFCETLVQFMEYVKKLIDERALHKREYDSRVNERQTQTAMEKISGPIYEKSLKAEASDYDNSDLVPPRQHVVPTAEKTDSSQQGLEFLFSPLLEEYYNPAHGHAEDNNNDQAPNASFQEDEFINPFCTRVYMEQRSSIKKQFRGNQTMPVQTDDSLP